MTPDRTNYEIWLIDYLDGNLDPRQVEQLMAFLNENPDIKEEFREMSNYSIRPGDIFFRNKSSLKKSVSDISESQFEYLCIAASENDLSAAQTDELNEMIAESPEKRKTHELFQKLKLIAPEVEFRNKSKLRKLTAGQRIVRISVIGLSAAATVSLMISILNPPLKNNTGKEFGLAISTLKDSDTIVADKVKIAGIIQSGEKKEINNTPVSIISSVPKTLSDEVKSPDKVLSSAESSTKNSIIQPVIISRIDFKQDVNIAGESSTGKLVAIKIPDMQVFGIEEKSGFNAFIAKLFREKIFKSNDPGTGQLKAYEIADAGINGLNKLLGWQMSLKKNKDAKGEVKSVYFSSRLLKFNAPVKKVALLP
jgi:hypothetical protein